MESRSNRRLAAILAADVVGYSRLVGLDEEGTVARLISVRADERFDEELQSLQTSLDRQQELFNLQQESLIAEFVALESALSELNSTSDFLSTQLASLQATSNNKRN